MPTGSVSPVIDCDRVAAARARLSAVGDGIGDWARRHGFAPKLVYSVLSGTRRCARGQSHRIAVLLDLKDGELDDISQRGGGAPVRLSSAPDARG
ncbi:hypothetical protein [uncultured Sphingomonas sp.]|uniref:hypothetical protein n=1 Tax=uncultured Sphingomonas sp. TaxID=158754 RepID=UPI002584053E|nr:hypothetical protein [uncultured Sphingomonas sp.]